ETINPWDLPPGQREPSQEHIMFLVNLALHMIDPKPGVDKGLLGSLLSLLIRQTYKDLENRRDFIPHFRDLMQRLEQHHDEKGVQEITDLARYAASKLRDWCENGPYANLFDRDTQIDLIDDWLYFNIEGLKKDPRLESAMSFLISQI